MPSEIAWDPRRIARILSESARIALGYYHEPQATVKSDRSLVTRADQDIEEYLESELADEERGSFLIGEETIEHRSADHAPRAFGDVAWIVDPIDGTAPYAHHIPTWGISIARMEAGTLTDGAIYLPITDELFITVEEEVEYGSLEGDRVVVTRAASHLSREHRSTSGMIALTQAVAKGRGIDVPNPVQALGCAVLPLTYLLLDRYIGYIGKVKLWDCAGVLPMLARAGFVSRLVDGTPVGTEVNDEAYILESDSRDRWKLRDRLVCAADEETVRYVIDAVVE